MPKRQEGLFTESGVLQSAWQEGAAAMILRRRGEVHEEVSSEQQQYECMQAYENMQTQTPRPLFIKEMEKKAVVSVFAIFFAWKWAVFLLQFRACISPSNFVPS